MEANKNKPKSEIGRIIRERRLALGITQEELAKRMGYKSKSTINKIELGINDVNQSTATKFAVALNTTIAYLMGWTDDPVDHNDNPTIDFDILQNDHERKLLLSFRGAGKLTDEEYADLESMFEATLDVYLKARGKKKN